MNKHTKIVFLWQILKIYMILWYSNRQLVAMAAILNKTFPSAGILGDFAPRF